MRYWNLLLEFFNKIVWQKCKCCQINRLDSVICYLCSHLFCCCYFLFLLQIIRREKSGRNSLACIIFQHQKFPSFSVSLFFLNNFQRSALYIFNRSSNGILPVSCVFVIWKAGHSRLWLCTVPVLWVQAHRTEALYNAFSQKYFICSCLSVVFPSWLLSSRPRMMLWIQRINSVSSHYKHFKWLPPTEHMDWSHIFSSVCCSRTAILHNYK